MKRRVALGLVVLSILAVKMSDAAGSGLVSKDQSFIKGVAADSLTEVKLGEIASEKATSPSVKDFADQMVKDHSKADAELKSIAITHNLDLPAALDKEHQAIVDKLVRVDEGKFDRAYVKEMISAHKKAVAALEGEQSTRVNDLKGWTDKTLPVIKHHLQMAEKIRSVVPGLL